MTKMKENFDYFDKLKLELMRDSVAIISKCYKSYRIKMNLFDAIHNTHSNYKWHILMKELKWKKELEWIEIEK